MDPKATLIKLLEAIHAADAAEAEEALDDLMAWKAKGGFLPEAFHTALNALRFAD